MSDQEDLRLSSYHYHLPKDQIAQKPTDQRDGSKLMVLQSDALYHRQFTALPEYLNSGDLLVVNNTKVFPARLFGQKQSGGRVELFLLELPRITSPGLAYAKALIKASRRPKPGAIIDIAKDIFCTVVGECAENSLELTLHYDPQKDLLAVLQDLGQIPLPPYIERNGAATDQDRDRYQTVYAAETGAVAAPTAGLHFTPELLEAIRKQGVFLAEITLHVGYGTFAPVRSKDITHHQIHREYLQISRQTVAAIKKTKSQGKRVWAVGTTSVRALEYVAHRNQELDEYSGWCDLYIYPGFDFKVVDCLITNFHLPNSSLLFLVSALCGRKRLLTAYREAVDKKYRFFSYGDAMAIITR